jgi:uracil-DNA glycosylase family 4
MPEGGGGVTVESRQQLSFLGDTKPVLCPLWDQAQTLDELAQVILVCRRCRLRDGCKQVVFGEGYHKADIVLIGEGPGQAEDEVGRPFLGRAGQLLDAILESVDLNRSEVFISNIVKCRPPKNRLPLPDEVRTCLPYIKAQLRIIRPKIVVCLGALAAQTLIDPGFRVTRDRGQWIIKDGLEIMPTFHPAALLRDPRKKRPVWEDFKAIKKRYEQLKG